MTKRPASAITEAGRFGSRLSHETSYFSYQPTAAVWLMPSRAQDWPQWLP